MLKAVALVPVLLLSVCLAGCVDIDLGPNERFRADFNYHFDLKPGGRISLENSNGAIDITGWDQDRVEIEGEKFASTEAALREVKIDIRNQPDFIEIRTVRPSNSGFMSNTGARYTIRVPRTAKLDSIRSANGRIEIRDIDAGARIRTTNGRIRGERIRGGIEAQTSNGGIDLRSIEGNTHLETSNGPIALAFTHPPTADIHAETSNGRITLELPSETNARLEASTSNAEARTDFDLNGHVHVDRHNLSGNIGKSEGSRPEIELHTSNGRISVTKN